MRHVYLIAPNEAGPCKIGIAKNPAGRLKELQTGNAQKLALHGSCPCEQAEALERAVHRRLAPANMTGEWFGLPVSVAWQTIMFEFAALGGVAPLASGEGAEAERMRALPVARLNRGRPRIYASAADRQRACRSRKAQSHVKA